MKFDANISALAGGLNEAFIGISCKDRNILKFLEDLKDKDLTVEITKRQKKRSLDSNAYMWVLLDKMARVLKTDKDRVYLMMLERYGKFTPVVVRPEAADRMIQEWRTCKVLGEVKVNGQVGVQMLCFYGSSTYNQEEMTALINGIVNECHDLNIETMTPQEIKEMNERWEPLYDYR